MARNTAPFAASQMQKFSMHKISTLEKWKETMAAPAAVADKTDEDGV